MTLPFLPPFLNGPIGSFFISLLVWALIATAGYFGLTYLVRSITRRLPGEIDDELLGIVRRPLLILCIVFGVMNSARALQLPADLDALVQRVLYSVLVIVATRMIYRILMDVVLRHAQARALKTETRLDDVAVAMARLLTPVAVAITAGIILFAQWGVDVGAALAGLGIAGLVVGLALQETLTNIVAGISILADEPFTPGELIVMPEDKVCRVEHIGLRTTRLYNVEAHAMIYVPNKDLANAAITNIFKPSYDMRTTLDVGVAYTSNLNVVMSILEEVLRDKLPKNTSLSISFFDANENGPPFGITRAALSEMLLPHFSLIEECVPTDSIAIFAGKERWQVWQRH